MLSEVCSSSRVSVLSQSAPSLPFCGENCPPAELLFVKLHFSQRTISRAQLCWRGSIFLLFDVQEIILF